MNVSKIFSLFLIFFSVMTIAHSVNFSVCGTTINEPFFEILDDTNKSIFIVDNEGDIYFEGQDHTTDNRNSFKSFEIGDNIFFNSQTSMFVSFSQGNITLPNEQGLIFKNNEGEEVAKFGSSGSVYTLGEGIYQDSQAACNPDGNYCNGINLETRDYFCEIFDSKSGECVYQIDSIFSCSDLDYNYCNETTRKRVTHNCGVDSCNIANDTVIETCVASNPTYQWTCKDSNTRQRVETIYSPICSPEGCSQSSTSSTIQEENCGSGKICKSGQCEDERVNFYSGTGCGQCPAGSYNGGGPPTIYGNMYYCHMPSNAQMVYEGGKCLYKFDSYEGRYHYNRWWFWGGPSPGASTGAYCRGGRNNPWEIRYVQTRQFEIPISFCQSRGLV